MSLFLLSVLLGLIGSIGAEVLSDARSARTFRNVSTKSTGSTAAILFDNIAATGVYGLDGGSQTIVLAFGKDTMQVAYFDNSAIDGAMSSAPYTVVTPAQAFSIPGLNEPHGIWTPEGNVIYIADTINFVVRAFDGNSNTSSVFAGQAGVEGHSGDGGAATDATLYSPYAGCYGFNDNSHYIADFHGCTIRKVDSSGIITTFYGSHRVCEISNSHLDHPSGLGTDGNVLYVSQRGNKIISISLSDSSIVQTVMGDTGVAAVTPDNPNGYSASDTVYRPVCFFYSGGIGFFCEKNTIRVLNFNSPSLSTVTFPGLGHTRGVCETNYYTLVADSLNKKIYATASVMA